MTQTKYLIPLTLLLGDLLALTLFVYVGQRDHELVSEANPILGVLATTAMFAAPWAVTGWWLGAFPARESLSARTLFARSLNAWLVTALLALLIRSYALGRAVVPTSFITATLIFGGLFLFAWRILFLLWWKLNARRPASSALR
jgi:hypothetical protein